VALETQRPNIYKNLGARGCSILLQKRLSLMSLQGAATDALPRVRDYLAILGTLIPVISLYHSSGRTT